MKNHKIKTKAGAELKGRYTFTKAKIETPEQWALVHEIDVLRATGQAFLHLVDKLNSICHVRRIVYENLVPTVGRTMIANNLTNVTPTYNPLINKFAVGTGATAPDNADTTLETETYRNNVASRTNAANIAFITGFINATEDDGTYAEAGLFADGTGSPDTGALISRVAISITKSNTETLTIDWDLTIS